MLTIYVASNYATLLGTPKSNTLTEVDAFEWTSFEADKVSLLANLAKTFLKTNLLSTTSVVLALSMDYISSRQILLDQPRSDWEIYQAVQQNFNQYFPALDRQDFYMDFEVIKREVPDYDMRSLLKLFVAPKALIELFVSTFQTINLKIKAIDIDTLALGEQLKTCRWEGRGAPLPDPITFNMGICIENRWIYLMEWFEDGSLRLINSGLAIPFHAPDFVSFFKSWKGVDRLEDPLVFCMGSQDSLLQIQEILWDTFRVKSFSVTVFDGPSCRTDRECLATSYPLSLAIHYGLRLRHGD